MRISISTKIFLYIIPVFERAIHSLSYLYIRAVVEDGCSMMRLHIIQIQLEKEQNEPHLEKTNNVVSEQV